jgi:hypothetical protein
MKKAISALAIALSLTSFSLASAAVTCATSDHAVYNDDGTVVVGCISDAAWQKSMDEQTSRASKHLPVVPSGSIITDEGGIKWQVPNISYPPGWLDLTHTDAYRAFARQTAAELSGNFGWGYWINH